MITEARETTGATAALILHHARTQGGEEAVAEVLRRSGVPYTADELSLTSNWTSYATRLRLLEALTETLGDPRAAFAAGTAAATVGADHAGRLLVRFFSSPRAVFRLMGRGIENYSATAQVESLATTRTSATVRYTTIPPYEPSRLDCLLTQGFLASFPVGFGLPLADVEHDECQADGHPACVYRFTWARRKLRHLRRTTHAVARLETEALRGQLQDLQSAASDLVRSEHVVDLHERIVDRATSLVHAAYVLVLDGPGSPVRSRSVTVDEALELAATDTLTSPPGTRAVVFDVASTRRTYGRLLAVRRPDLPFSDADRSLLEAYARHAAAALDLVTALETSRREAARATALLTFANDLTSARGDLAVAQVAAQVLPGTVGGRTSAVLLWDEDDGELRVVATAGHDDAQTRALQGRRLRADATPELVAMLTHRLPAVVDVAGASPELAALLQLVGTGAMIVVPLLAGDALLGVVSVGWAAPLPEEAQREALVRLTGVADQTATALQNSRLVATVEHQSLHDSLTSLPNRVLFARRLDTELRTAEEDRSTAVLFCDLDRFKQVNDRLGHAAGDEMLRQVAVRLRGQLRDGDTVARLSGDEFAVLLTDVTDEQHAASVARRLVGCLDQPLRIDGREVRITSSIGVAVHHGPGGRSDKLLGAADSAMYEAKLRGRDQVALAGTVDTCLVPPSFENELSRALSDGQLRLHFQPVVDLTGPEGGTVVGAEALLRWEHPRLGLLAPGSFLPLAEETGRIVDLDLWALENACRALAGWMPPPQKAGGVPPLRVAVNLAPATLVDDRLVPAVRRALSSNFLDAEQLHLELVESRSLSDVPGVVARLVELRRLGVRISLDDFGTGFSTLAWLQSLPVDQIKIDRTFVSAMSSDGSLSLVRGVLALARELDIEVVAEGVEEPEQLAMLRAAGCDMAQGYLLGRPNPGFGPSVEDHTAT
ncbi:putative bifunctional diguanylate cyclase/phosphodiesterase [Sanguibacter suaedae]|nr:EAL domain-containing protein [Sanguibacter suaedae]